MKTKYKSISYGNKDYNFEEKAAIDETVKPQIVKADGTVVQDSDLVDGYYVVPGQGKYKVTAKGKDVNVELYCTPKVRHKKSNFWGVF